MRPFMPRMRRFLKSAHGMRRFSLVFESSPTEREFLRSRADDLTRGMSWWTALGVLMSIITFFAGGEQDRSARSSPESAMVERRRDWLTLAFGLLCGAFFLFFQVAHRTSRFGPQTCELAATLWLGLCLFAVPVLERFYFAKLNGYDPYELYPDFSFEDATVLLFVDAMVTAGHLLVPIRWRTLSATEVLGVLIYAACCVSGTPGLASKGQFNLLTLAILSVMAAVGKRRLEYHERRAFLQIIREKSLRVQTEFQLSQAGGEGLGSSNGSSEAREACRGALAGPQGAGTDSSQASQRNASNSEVSFNLSESVVSSGAAAARPPQPAVRARQEVGVQISGQPAAGEGHRDCSTETEMVWAADAFRCKRCSARPPRHAPLPPPEEVPEGYFCRVCRGRRRRRRRAAGSDSDTGVGSSASSSAGAVRQDLALTPMKSKRDVLCVLMLQTNFVVPAQACCMYHAGVQDLYTTISIMRGARCRRTPWDPGDSQCLRCLLLTDVDEVTHLCDLCTEEIILYTASVDTDTDDGVSI